MSTVELMYCVVKEWNVVKVKLTKEGAERVTRLQAAKCCLACELPIEPGQQVVCGVHVNCDNTQRYAIRKGKTTVDDLIKKGERRPPGEQGYGPKPKTDYAAKLLGRKKKGS
jgi:hypothetical protein